MCFMKILLDYLKMTSETSEEISRKNYLKHRYFVKRYRGILGWFLFLGGLCISYLGYVYPNKAYIRCNDVTISHKLNSDTISISLLLVVSLFVPFVMMTILEWIDCHTSTSCSHYQNSNTANSIFKKGFKRACNHFLSLLVGSLFAFFIVEVLKTATCEPRPHFMESCRPNLCNPNITKQSSESWIYVSLENCTNPLGLSRKKLIDAMKSFPSGHACIGIFTAVFMTLYVQMRVKVKWSWLLCAWLQLIWWTWALLCCVSRVMDRRHHWWDVLAGAIIGGTVAYATVANLCDWFTHSESSHRSTTRISILDVGNSDSPTQLTTGRNGHFESRNFAAEEQSDLPVVKAPLLSR